MKKWSNTAKVLLPPRRYGDEKIWWQYSLYLVCNRHVADFMDNETVSSALNKMAERIPLPYAFCEE